MKDGKMAPGGKKKKRGMREKKGRIIGGHLTGCEKVDLWNVC